MLLFLSDRVKSSIVSASMIFRIVSLIVSVSLSSDKFKGAKFRVGAGDRTLPQLITHAKRLSKNINLIKLGLRQILPYQDLPLEKDEKEAQKILNIVTSRFSQKYHCRRPRINRSDQAKPAPNPRDTKEQPHRQPRPIVRQSTRQDYMVVQSTQPWPIPQQL